MLVGGNVMKLKKIGSLLRGILRIGMIVGGVLLIGFYWILKSMDIGMDFFLISIYPCGISFLVFCYQFIGLFKMLEDNTPFCEDTIRYLRKGMYISFVISGLVGIAFGLLFLYDFYTLGIKACVGFIAILFFGVGIALYILKELFNEAIEYKEENDLTI